MTLFCCLFSYIMRRLSCCFTTTSRVLPPVSEESYSQSSEENMKNPSKISNAGNGTQFENSEDNLRTMGNSSTINIVSNHDFSAGLDSWHPNCCEAFVVSPDSSCIQGNSNKLGSGHTVITNRKETWQGLEQDITTRVSTGSTYTVAAHVGISGALQGFADVQATLRLEYQNLKTSYEFIGRKSVSQDCWEMLEGTFTLSSKPDRVVFYLEGPSPGVDLLVKSVAISSSSSTAFDNSEDNLRTMRSSSTINIVSNHDFSSGLDSWHPNCCEAFVVSPDSSCIQGNSKKLGSGHTVITNRKETWQGLEQDITTRVSTGSTYTVAAHVGISGALQGFADVQAMLKLEYHNLNTSYEFIGRKSVSQDCWEMLEGTFTLSSKPDRVVFYLDGPSPGVDLLIKSVVISCSSSTTFDNQSRGCDLSDEEIISNYKFDDGLNNWSGRGCKILLHDSMADGKIVPQSGKFFASATERTQNWNGIQQEITGKVNRKLAYEVYAVVRLFGNNASSSEIRATLWVQSADQREQYIGVAKVQATDKDWAQMQGKFLINGSPSRVVIFLEGPPPGVDILLNSLAIKHASKVPPSPPPLIEDAAFGVNIISNSNLNDGTNGWFPLGNCSLSVGTGSPHILPPMAAESLGVHQPLSGRYILVKNRTQTWMGPAQMITDKVKLYMTYQVSAWVRIGPGASVPQNVNVALGVDDQWVNGGQAEIGDDRWHEIGGSFRIEKEPVKVMVYVQGPAPGVDLMVAGMQIFPVDRQARFRHLRKETDKIRKRDVVLKLSGSDASSLLGTFIRVKQTQNSFPFGSCLMRTNMDNEDFTNFFVKNFNWAVFGNELKWYWTEAQQGNFNYKDADELLNFCTSNNIQVRGHCIFWEVESAVQQWLRNLNKNDLMTAVQNRLTGLLTRYKGEFRHYDVNNEMLHGSFYQDHLGKEIRVFMFKTANQLDPSATLFVNDYHIEDGCDTRSYPEKYIEHILDLQEKGAPVGGIGIQGHIDSPVGPVVRTALNKLGVLGLPIWFTELDFSSNNECIRAEDLEVMFREAYAHPAVEGLMLWGFWELFMSRENSHLVNAEGDLNEAGRRYLALKDEWLTRAHGHIDAQAQFAFRGFQGSYQLEIGVGKTKIVKTFVVDKGEEPLVVSINL